MPKTKITYIQIGDYLIPNLTVPPEDDTRPIGVWGRRHYNYLKNHRKAIYSIMVMDNTLHTHLADINEQAEEMFSQLVKQLSERDGITESLKAADQMGWVQRMNAVRETATEIVNREMIYA